MKTVAQIRKRKSYKRFCELYDFLMTEPNPDETLYQVHRLIETYRGFGSKDESNRAKESIGQVIADVPPAQPGASLYKAAQDVVSRFENWGNCSDWREARQAWKESIEALRAAMSRAPLEGYDLTNRKAIQLYFHCGACLTECPEGVAPSDYQAVEAGFTERGVQVWCSRHDLNMIHIDFEGRTHPANTTAYVSTKRGRRS